MPTFLDETNPHFIEVNDVAYPETPVHLIPAHYRRLFRTTFA